MWSSDYSGLGNETENNVDGYFENYGWEEERTRSCGIYYYIWPQGDFYFKKETRVRKREQKSKEMTKESGERDWSISMVGSLMLFQNIFL